MDDNNEETLVSIICLVYNHEPFLRTCLDGFIMQECDFKFEAIVHDDASQDGSVGIIKEYADKYPDIIKPIYETENQYSKQDGSLKRILKAHVKGKYVAHCEGDDCWIDPHKLSKQISFLESHADFTLCGTNAIVIEDNLWAHPFNNLPDSKELSLNDCVAYWLIPTASIVMRKTTYMYTPAWLDNTLEGDYAMIIKSRLLGKVYCMNEFTCIWRHYSASASALFVKSQGGMVYYFLRLVELLEFFNKDLDYEYKDIFEPVIHSKKKQISVINQRIKYGFLYDILHPQYLVSDIKKLIHAFFKFSLGIRLYRQLITRFIKKDKNRYFVDVNKYYIQ